MKSGRIIALMLLSFGLGAYGIASDQTQRADSQVKPWGTSSKATQGELTFIGVFKGTPDFLKGTAYKAYPSYLGRRWAYFRFAKGTQDAFYDAEFSGKGVAPFDLIAQGVTESYNANLRFNYLAVAVPEMYSPEYQNGTLTLRKHFKAVGQWQLSGMPKPTRQIPQNEHNVLTGETAGCRLALVSPVSQRKVTESTYLRMYGNSWEPILKATRPASTPDDLYRVYAWLERTSWFAWQENAYMIPYQLPVNGRVKIPFAVGLQMPCDRIAFAAKVQKYRALEETVVLKDLVIERRPNWPNIYMVKSCSNTHIRTKSGYEVEIELGFDKNRPCFYENCFTINLKASQPFKDAILDNSPLYQQTKKPISVECLGYRGSTIEGNRSHWGFKLPPNRGEQTIRIPEFKLKIRQTAVLEEKTLHFLAPTKEVVNATKPGKQNKAR